MTTTMMNILVKTLRVLLLLAFIGNVKADDITVNSVSECNNFDGILKLTAASISNGNYGETATAYITISSTQDLSSSTIYAEVDKLSQKVYPTGSTREAIQLCNYFSSYSSNGATCPASTDGEEITSDQISFKVPSVSIPLGGSGTITLKAFASESSSDDPILCAVINGSFTKNISPVVYMAQAPTAVKATAGLIGAAFLAIVALVVAKAVTSHKAKTSSNSAADPLGYQTASDGVQA